MSIWTCLKCTARYAVGLERCPQCQSTEYTDNPDAPAAVAEAAPEQPAVVQRRAKAPQAADTAGPAQDGGTP